MRVTFDTNCLDAVVRPHLFRKDARLPLFQKLNQALSTRMIEGVFSETMITIEGINKADRAAVFGSTRLTHNRTGTYVSEDGTLITRLELKTVQPVRTPLDRLFAARIDAAVRCGLRILRAPRIGMLFIEDTDKNLYLQESDSDAISRRLDRYHDALHAIEVRGLGRARLDRMAAHFAKRIGAVEPWYLSLSRTSDIHEERAVERAFAEWSDADSIAAHIGYGIDVFCTEDKGNTGGDPSIFDTTNRRWLEQTYGVNFVTLFELAEMI